MENLSKEELITKVKALEVHVTQLRNIIAKKDKSNLPLAKERAKKKDRKFDFNKYKKRHVLLQVCYFGWDYNGFAVAEEAGRTIESELFAALLQTKLVESRAECNYHRCGRTDRGVSGTGQVVSLDLRTALQEGEAVWQQESYTGPRQQEEAVRQELDYCTLLNRNLPPDIRVVAWAPAPTTQFSARFECQSRGYRYCFPRGRVDTARLAAAGQRLLGSHDFRNLCKMDVNNGVVKFIRTIDSVSVETVQRDNSQAESSYDLCCIIIRSKAFLWHQIRCIVAVLLMVGEGLEDAEVITELLDVERNPCRPAYQMAADLPLNLDCAEYIGLDWRVEPHSSEFTLRSLQRLWSEQAVRAAMIRGKLRQLELASPGLQVDAQLDSIAGRERKKVYTNLMQLPRCPSLEDKIKTVVKRRKLVDADEMCVE